MADSKVVSVTSHPAFVLAVLGAASGVLGTYVPGPNWAHDPYPGVFGVLIGLWFGLVVGFGAWHWGRRSWGAAAAALLATWLGWEAAVNLALIIRRNWPPAMSDMLQIPASGFAAGAVGALATWAGVAWFSRSARRGGVALGVAVVGALFGLLLPLLTQYDLPAALFVPWQAAVAASLGWCFATQGGRTTDGREP